MLSCDLVGIKQDFPKWLQSSAWAFALSIQRQITSKTVQMILSRLYSECILDNDGKDDAWRIRIMGMLLPHLLSVMLGLYLRNHFNLDKLRSWWFDFNAPTWIPWNCQFSVYCRVENSSQVGWVVYKLSITKTHPLSSSRTIGSQVVRLLIGQRIRMYANDPSVGTQCYKPTGWTQLKPKLTATSSLFPSNYVFFKFFPIFLSVESQIK